MKQHPLIIAVFCCALPFAASAQDKPPHPMPVELALGAMPVVAGNPDMHSAGTVSLRESLRQPWSEAGDKPYRLSSQERQRMREQLRAQSSLRELPPVK